MIVILTPENGSWRNDAFKPSGINGESIKFLQCTTTKEIIERLRKWLETGT